MRRFVVLLAFALAACGDAADGARAYREGRFAEAHGAFVRATDARPDDTPPELLYDRALSALRAGALDDAESSGARAASSGSDDVASLSAFLRGNVAYARAELAERQAGAPEAEPFAFDLALSHADAARRAWESAAITRDDWPEARRNVERALRKLDVLRKKKADAEARRKRETASGGKPKPRPLPKPPDDPGSPQVPDPEPVPDRGGSSAAGQPATSDALLSREQVNALFERLAEKEREKRALRRARRAGEGLRVERDW